MTYEEYLASRIRSDLFAAIKYQTPRRSPNGPLGLQLAPRNFALQWIVEKSWERFSAGVPTCYQLNSITSKSLFGDAITWSGYEPGVQHTFGLCLRYFVSKGMLPLHCINLFQSGTKVYVPLTMEAAPCQ